MKILNFFGRRNKRDIEIFSEVEAIGQKFSSVLSKITDGRALVDSWEYVLSNAETENNIPSILNKGKSSGLVELHSKKGAALHAALELYKLFLADSNRFAEEKQRAIADIWQLDAKLARKIGRLQIKPMEELRILAQLKRLIGNEPMLVSYIKTDYWEIISQIDSMKDVKLAARIKRQIILLSNKEAEEIEKCARDIRSWPARAAYGIPLFIERGNLFLDGGKSRFDGEEFIGFGKNLMDGRLGGEMKRTPEVRRLTTFQQEIEFFNRAKQAIKISVETQGDWKDFLKFYDKLDDYIKMVREDFGNASFAEMLVKFKKNKHQMPLGWEEEMEALGDDLLKRAYELVIFPAGNALLGIFNEATARVQEEQSRAFAELQRLISKYDPQSRIGREFLSVLIKARGKLRNKIRDEETKLKITMGSALRQLPELVSTFDELMSKTNFDAELLRAYKTLSALSTWQQYALGNSSVLKADEGVFVNDGAVRQLNRLLASMQKSVPIAETELMLKRTVERKLQKSLRELHGLMDIAQKDLLPKIDEYAKYVTSRLEEDFLPTINPVIIRFRAEYRTEAKKTEELDTGVLQQKKAASPPNTGSFAGERIAA